MTTTLPAHFEQAAIDQLIAAFFRVFDNRHGRQPDLASLHDLFLPQAQIIKNTADGHEIYSVTDFIAPRMALLSNGSLVDFAENEEQAQTLIFGGVATRVSLYRKAGLLSGQAFSACGVKSFQLLKVGVAWKIAACAWQDEHPGFEPAALWLATVAA